MCVSDCDHPREYDLKSDEHKTLRMRINHLWMKEIESLGGVDEAKRALGQYDVKVKKPESLLHE